MNPGREGWRRGERSPAAEDGVNGGWAAALAAQALEREGWARRAGRIAGRGEDAAPERALEAADVVGTEMRRLVEHDGAVVAPGEDAVEDDDVEVEVGVEGGAEAVQEGDEALGSAGVAADAGEAVGEDAAAEVGAEVSLHPARHALAVGIRRGGVGQESLDVVLHDGVERRGRGISAPVDRREAIRSCGMWRVGEGSAGS